MLGNEKLAFVLAIVIWEADCYCSTTWLLFTLITCRIASIGDENRSYPVTRLNQQAPEDGSGGVL